MKKFIPKGTSGNLEIFLNLNLATQADTTAIGIIHHKEYSNIT